MLSRLQACSALLLVCCRGALGQSLASFQAASASSAHAAGEYPAEAAVSDGSGYWCSSGNHLPSQRVTWTGSLSARQEVIGVSIDWAYGPGELRILTSADGGNFEEAIPWRRSSRSESSYVDALIFDAPHSAKTVSVVMRGPQPWGFFGINSISLLVKAGPSMLVSAASPETGEVCVVSEGSGLAARPCLETIASGVGRDIFSVNDESQLVSEATGKCAALAPRASGGADVVLRECSSADEAGDGRSKVTFSPGGQVKFNAADLCLSANPGAKVSAIACSDVGPSETFLVVAAPEFDAGSGAMVQDGAQVLQAAVARQSALLQKLRQRLGRMGSCKVVLARGNSSALTSSLSTVAQAREAAGTEPAGIAIAKIDALFGVDLVAAKSLIAETGAALSTLGV